MANTSTLHVRIDTQLKESAERILAQVNLTPSDAIKLLYKQIELQGGLPFEIKLPEKKVAEQKLLYELKAGEQSVEQNGWMSLEESKKAFGL